MDPVTYEIKTKCQIRPYKSLKLKARAETAWTVDIGIFKRYLKESNEKVLRKCFDNDWEYMKDVAKKYKKSEEKPIKEEMYKVWK